MVIVKVTGLLAQKFTSNFNLNVNNWGEVVDAIECNHNGFKTLYKQIELAGARFMLIVERDGEAAYVGEAKNIQLLAGDIVKVVPVFTPYSLWTDIRDGFFKAVGVLSLGILPALYNFIKHKDEEGNDENYRADIGNEKDKDTFGNTLSNRGPLDTAIPVVYGTMLVGSVKLAHTITNSLTPIRQAEEEQVLQGLLEARDAVLDNEYSDVVQLGYARLEELRRILRSVVSPEFEVRARHAELTQEIEKASQNITLLATSDLNNPNSYYVALRKRLEAFVSDNNYYFAKREEEYRRRQELNDIRADRAERLAAREDR